MVAAGDRLRRDGDAIAARAAYGQAATLQAEIVGGMSAGRHLDTLACGCVLLYRLAGLLLDARRHAELFLQLPVDEPGEGWLLDQVSELTLGSYVPEARRDISAMGELIRLRRLVGQGCET